MNDINEEKSRSEYERIWEPGRTCRLFLDGVRYITFWRYVGVLSRLTEYLAFNLVEIIFFNFSFPLSWYFEDSFSFRTSFWHLFVPNRLNDFRSQSRMPDLADALRSNFLCSTLKEITLIRTAKVILQ